MRRNNQSERDRLPWIGWLVGGLMGGFWGGIIGLGVGAGAEFVNKATGEPVPQGKVIEQVFVYSEIIFIPMGLWLGARIDVRT